MIPRTLVPVNVRRVTAEEAKRTGHRTTTYMDDRTVIPSGPSDAPPLDGKSTIPAHFPLGVLVNRTLVARGMPAKPFENLTPVSDTIPLAILDSRVVVPAYVEPADPEERKEFEHRPELTADLREVVEPDIFLTGDANLLMEPEEKRDSRWDFITRTLSVLVHVGLIIFLIFTPKMFPTHVPTQEETDMARQQLTYLLPPEAPAPRTPPAPKLRITPKTLNRVAPEPPPEPTPTPAPVAPDPEAARGIAGCAAAANSRGAATAAADAAGAFPARTGEACAAAKSESAEPAIAVRQSSRSIAGSHSAQQPWRRNSGSRTAGRFPADRVARADPECSRAQRFLLPPKAWIFQAIFSGFWRL